ncbi:hypothetical protein EVAR_99869_1 [Eumeta japonica]|uniref:Uncharacterized protein n=1 Tax=Eumeta variegata TaxID=151549 RepID=A0A4C1ZH61_EUMVA|nr:hypothetical protein EVAR_99869_1 [Eumeta japonica]
MEKDRVSGKGKGESEPTELSLTGRKTSVKTATFGKPGETGIVGVATLAVATGRHAIIRRPVTAQFFFHKMYQKNPQVVR